jgi:hypothetical protein
MGTRAPEDQRPKVTVVHVDVVAQIVAVAAA